MRTIDFVIKLLVLSNKNGKDKMKNLIKNPDGSVSREELPPLESRERKIALALFESQKYMPSGQSWNLYSWGACCQIANKINKKIS